MKVIISVGGRFHSFNLAQQLLKRDALKFIITSYPKFITRKWSLPDDKVKSVFIKEILERGWNKLSGFIKNSYNPQFLITEIFDKLALKKLEPADIFVGWSSFSLHSLRRAKKMGMKIVLEHGNSHILYATKILKEEYEKFNIKISDLFSSPHPKIIEKELKEYEEADYICIPSSFVKRTFLEKGVSEEKLIQIPYGVDLEKFKQIPKEDNVFRIIFAGTICLRKGVHYLLQAFSELKLANSELLLLGNVSEEMSLFLAKYKKENIKVLKVNHFDLYKYYSLGSVFVLFSIEEGLARVIPEAMACGLPIICTTNTGGEDIVRDGIDGFIIPIRDVDALKEKILYLYENQDEARQMGQRAKQKVASGFTWEDYGDRIIAAYLKATDQ